MTTILGIVTVLAVVQSVFGIGLLVFGTPTLLLLGHSFAETLAILLPASATISVLQVWKAGGHDLAFVRSFMGWCMVPLVATLTAALIFDLRASLNVAVAVLLAGFVGLRLSPRLAAGASAWVMRHERVWLVLMGAVHGLSNLGGGLLVIFAMSRFRRKEEIRSLVAVCYGCWAAVQLIVLAVVSPHAIGVAHLQYAAVAGIVFLIVGQPVFQRVSVPVFDRLLSLFAAGYAGLLGLRAAGVL